MKIIESYTKNNRCYTNPTRITPKGIMLHSVGINQSKASALVNTNNYNKPGKIEGVHAFIDANSGDVYQALPWNYRANHCGGADNNTHIAVEMCEPDKIRYLGGSTFTFGSNDLPKIQEQITTVYDSAVELFAKLCKDYGLDPTKEGVIISHYEGGQRGVASRHDDPEHLWRQAKTSYTMAGFRKDVKTALGILTKATNPSVSTAAAPSKSSKSEFKVKVDSPHLNIRKAPGTYDTNGKPIPTQGKFTGVGVFTIVEVQNGTGSNSGWGLLKSYEKNRDGWISLDFAKKV